MPRDTDPPPPSEPTTLTHRGPLVIPPGAAREMVAGAVQRVADALVELETTCMQLAAQFDAAAEKGPTP